MDCPSILQSVFRIPYSVFCILYFLQTRGLRYLGISLTALPLTPCRGLTCHAFAGLQHLHQIQLAERKIAIGITGRQVGNFHQPHVTCDIQLTYVPRYSGLRRENHVSFTKAPRKSAPVSTDHRKPAPMRFAPVKRALSSQL